MNIDRRARPIRSAHASTSAWHLVLPVCTLGLTYMALYLRLMRGAMTETRSGGWVRAAARARPALRVGSSGGHIARPALLPVVTMLGLQIGAMLGGSVVIETVFAIPGLGSLAYLAVSQPRPAAHRRRRARRARSWSSSSTSSWTCSYSAPRPARRRRATRPGRMTGPARVSRSGWLGALGSGCSWPSPSLAPVLKPGRPARPRRPTPLHPAVTDPRYPARHRPARVATSGPSSCYGARVSLIGRARGGRRRASSSASPSGRWRASSAAGSTRC